MKDPVGTLCLVIYVLVGIAIALPIVRREIREDIRWSDPDPTAVGMIVCILLPVLALLWPLVAVVWGVGQVGAFVIRRCHYAD